MFQVPDPSIVPWWWKDIKDILAVPMQLLLAGLVAWALRKLGGIHTLVNSNLTEVKRQVAALNAQLYSHGIEPDSTTQPDDGRTR